MADAELKVRIDAEIGGLQAGLKQAEQAVNSGSTNINNSVGKIQGSFTILNNTKFTFGQNFTSASNQVANQATKTGQVLGTKLSAGANQAGFALTNLGRVAQDAPFGFIGIQNNLNPLLESFQQLKQQTGSTGAAFKALGQSLIGPAGIGIALSVVSSAIILYQQYQQKANKTLTDSKKAADDYADSLGQIEQVQLRGATSAAKEQTELNVLFGIYQNANIPLGQRKKAYDELQKLYPDYFGNLKFEKEASDKTRGAYDKLSESILASGRARAAVDLITKNSQRQLENEQKIIDINTQLTKEQTTQKRLQGIVESENLLAKQEANILTSKQKEILDQYLGAAGKEQKLIQQKNNLLTDSNILTDKNNQLNKAATAEAAKGGIISGNIGGDAIKTKTSGKDKEADKAKKLAEDAKKKAAELQKEAGIFNQKLITGLIEFNAQAAVEADKKKAQLDIIDPDAIAQAEAQVEGFNKFINDKFLQVTPILQTPFQKLGDYINSDILPQLGSSFKTFFDDILMKGEFSFGALGNAIKNTFLSVLANEATQSVLNILSGKGKSTIGADGTKKKGDIGGLLGGVLGLFGGGGGKAAGDAAGAIGGASKGLGSILGKALPYAGLAIGAVSLFSGLFKKKKSTEPAPPPVANYATSGYSGFTSGTDSGRVVFEISGTNLIGVLNRAGAKLQRYGG